MQILEKSTVRRNRTRIPRPVMTEDVISFSECRNNLASCFKQVAESHRPLFITQNGKPTTLIGNIADWEEYIAYRELIDDVKVAETELARGEYLTHNEFLNRLSEEEDSLRRELGL